MSRTTIQDIPVSTLCSNWLQHSRKDQSSGTTAGEYAGQRFKASYASYAEGSLRLLCAPVCQTEKHLGRFKAETRPRCLYFVVFCRIFGTPRSIFTAKVTEVFPDKPIACSGRCCTQEQTSRQAPPLAYTPCQRFKASCASYAEGSLHLLCAPPGRSGFHTVDDLSQSSLKESATQNPVYQ